jgi:hypothetical protein
MNLEQDTVATGYNTASSHDSNTAPHRHHSRREPSVGSCSGFAKESGLRSWLVARTRVTQTVYERWCQRGHHIRLHSGQYEKIPRAEKGFPKSVHQRRRDSQAGRRSPARRRRYRLPDVPTGAPPVHKKNQVWHGKNKSELSSQLWLAVGLEPSLCST